MEMPNKFSISRQTGAVCRIYRDLQTEKEQNINSYFEILKLRIVSFLIPQNEAFISTEGASPPPVRHVSTVAPNRQTSCETFPEHQLYCDNSHRYQTALCYKHNISSAQMVYRLVPPVLSGTQHQHLETQEQPVNTVQECLWFSVVFPGFHAFFFSRLLKGIQKSH